MQTFTSIDANVYIYKCKFTYANICIFIRRAEGWGGGGAWQAGRQSVAEGCCASRGRERTTRRLRASRGGTERGRKRWQACARKGCRADPAEQPTRRSEAEGGGSGVGAAAEALQRGGLPALAASLSAAPAGALPPCCPAPAGLAGGRRCLPLHSDCLWGRGLGTRRRRPSLPPSALVSALAAAGFPSSPLG